MAVKVVQPRFKTIFSGNEERAALAVMLWKETVAALKAASLITPANLARADRYVRARVEYESLYPLAAATGPVKEGPNGGDVFNFTWSAVEKLNDRLAKLEKAMFGETVLRAKENKPALGSTPSDEFLGPDNGLRQ